MKNDEFIFKCLLEMVCILYNGNFNYIHLLLMITYLTFANVSKLTKKKNSNSCERLSIKHEKDAQNIIWKIDFLCYVIRECKNGNAIYC